MVFKIFFCSEFPVIPEKLWKKEEEERQLRSALLFKQMQKMRLIRNSSKVTKKVFYDFIAAKSRNKLKVILEMNVPNSRCCSYN